MRSKPHKQLQMSKSLDKTLTITSTFQRYDGDTEPDFVFQLTKRLEQDFSATVITPNFCNQHKDKPTTNSTVIWFRYFFNYGERLAYEGGIPSKLAQNKLYYLLVPCFVLSEFLYTLSFLRNNTAKLIHAHWLVPQGLIAILAKMVLRVKTPVLITLHGADLYTSTNSLASRIKSFILAQADCITVVSNAMKQDVLALCPESSVIIAPMGVDFDLFGTNTPSTRRNFELLFVGRLVEKKGVKYLIEAFSILRRDFPDLTLRIIGDGTLRNTLETQVETLRIGEVVKFEGALSSKQVSSAFARATLCVIPSITAASGDREGLGLVTIEAMASGCPVVASDYAAVQDIIEDGVNGLIARQKDIAEISDKISLLLSHPTWREELANTARKTSYESFSWEVCSEKYRKIYHALIEG